MSIKIEWIKIMRQHVPNLDTNLTNNDFLDLIVSCFHSAIFGTVDQNGEPHTNIVDIDFNEDGRLIFATTNQKNFYRNIKGNNRVCLTALRGRETLSSVGFTLKGYVDEISPSYIDKILEIKPECIVFMQIKPKILILCVHLHLCLF